MKKPIIAIDIDDVLANSTESLRKVVNKKYGLALEPHHYKVPGDYHKYYNRVWETNGYGDIVSKDDLNQQMVLDQSHVPVHDQALAVLQKLSARYEFVTLSARNPTWLPATEKWMELNYPGVFGKVLFGGQHDNPEGKTKGDLCAEIGAKWLIDDNVVHCTSALDRGVNAVLFGEYGWHFDVPEHLIRCKNWKDVGEFFAKQGL